MHGQRIRQLRESIGWTQDDLVEAIGVAVLQINRYENEKNEPSAEMLSRLARALGCSSDYLLDLTSDPAPKSMELNNLRARERILLSAWRSGDRIKAVKVILDDE
jgi:transcriptional regulator with XRE-family HTH domain